MYGPNSFWLPSYTFPSHLGVEWPCVVPVKPHLMYGGARSYYVVFGVVLGLLNDAMGNQWLCVCHPSLDGYIVHHLVKLDIIGIIGVFSIHVINDNEQ